MGGIASPNLIPPVVNPILAEIDAAHANLSPDAQAAIEKAHGIAAPAGIAAPNGPAIEPPPGGGIQAPAPTTVGSGITPPGAESPKLAPVVSSQDQETRDFYRTHPGRYPLDEKFDDGGGILARGITPPGTESPRPVNPDAIPGVSEPAQDAAADNVSSAVIKSPAAPSLGAKIPETTPTPIGGKVSPELARITAPDNHRHDKTNTGTPGDNQIHNPWLRVPVQILDALGRGFFPGVEMAIPGTSGHHDVLVHQRQVEDTQERNAAKDQTEEELQRAQAEHATAEAQAVKNPQDKQVTNELELFMKDPAKFAEYRQAVAKAEKSGKPEFIKGGDGEILGMVDSAGKLHSASDPDLDPQAKAMIEAQKPKVPAGREGELPLGERVPQINEAMKARYQVLHPGKDLPEHYVLPSNATQKDFDRTDKLIEGEEHAFGTKANQDQTAELRRQTMALAQSNRENKNDADTKKAAFKAYTPALDSAERFNVMTKNYEDAVKNHDQQAMLSLLANHIGMTMGLQKGARLTKDIIHEAEVSRPWLQGMQAKFDKDGYLTGVNLTPQQMRQMISLGRERFAEDVTKGRSEARYQGSTDEGPDRIPSKATINHYTALANGDAKKAKELADADGWTVK